MKRIICLIALMSGCLLLKAEGTPDIENRLKEDAIWEKAYTYVAQQYAKAYLETQPRKPEKDCAKALGEKTFDKWDSLIDFLNNHNGTETAKSITTIRGEKSRWTDKNHRSKKELLKMDASFPLFKEINQINKKLNEDDSWLKNIINIEESSSSTENEITPGDTVSQKQPAVQNSQSIPETQVEEQTWKGSKSWISHNWLSVLALALIVALCVVIVLIYRQLAIQKERLERRKEAIENLKTDLALSQTKIERQLRKIEQTLAEYKAQAASNVNLQAHAAYPYPEKPTWNDTPEPAPTPIENAVFAKIQGGYLIPCDRSQAQYKIVVQPGDRFGRYAFCGDLAIARNNPDAIFDNAAEIRGIISDAKSYHTLENGEVEQNEGRWKIIKQSIIKFE